ncbi:MAG: hypothetical protein LBJ01_09880 [Tannerella sp.]|jgi:hypothetical protein|nr:hypothetical protein [Tannerella sp.]
MTRDRLALTIAVIAIILSIVAICTSLNSFSIDETAYLGWVVAVLSTLVVVLIGWNIFTVIDVKSEQKKTSDYLTAIRHQANMDRAKMYAKVYSSLSEFYRKEKSMVYEYYNFALLSVRFNKVVGEIPLCNTVISVMISSFPSEKCISTINKAYLLQIAATIRNDGIEGLARFDELHAMIMKMGSYD